MTAPIIPDLSHREQLTADLIPLAAELVATVRDYGPDDVAVVLARVPNGRHDALAVVLAAMVDPDQKPSRLLAWTRGGPVQSRDSDRRTPRHLQVKAVKAPHPNMVRRSEVARLSALGLSAGEIAERLDIQKRSVYRIRQAIAKAA